MAPNNNPRNINKIREYIVNYCTNNITDYKTKVDTIIGEGSDVEITIIAVVKAAPQVVGKPFLYQMAAPVDTRLVLTKKEMNEANDNYLPDTYFALCKDDGHFYVYNKNSEPNSETGKFTLITELIKPQIDIFDGGEII
jgi:hypothetical protein